ncbi:MAG: glycosyltransferase [Candidatus Sumerlaeia bacterium]|nr:glycosyltransferase [Candidatus Sumerlaeia bacterium]
MAEPTKGTILAFGAGRWAFEGFAGSPRYHLWSLARRGWQVVYIDPPIRFRMKSEWESHGELPFHSFRAGGVPPFAFRYTWSEKFSEIWRSMVARRLAGQAMEECKKRGIHPTVAWLGAPWHGALLRHLPSGIPRLYHVYDELPLSPIYTPVQRDRLTRWEGELLESCELTLCSSQPQLDRRRAGARNAILLQNAVNPDFLDTTNLPVSESGRRQIEAIRRLPRPRVLYGGVADHRLDPACFQGLLRGLGEGSLIIAGLMDKSLDPTLATVLANHPRVLATGSVVYTDFPHLYREADCLILAHRRNEFTDGMYPEKMNEYLASGVPIVSIALPEVVRLAREAGHPDAIRTAETPEEFARAVAAAIADEEPTPREARTKTARLHTWDVEADKLEAALSGINPG